MKSRFAAVHKLSCVALLALLLCGCASKDPLDYLPGAPAYAAINAEKMRGSDGAGRLVKTMKSMQPGADLLFDRVNRVYIALEGGANPTARTGYGVVTGNADFADYAMNELKTAGATEGKMSDRKVMTSGTISFTPIGKQGLLFFSKPEELDKMVAVSKKKSPGARASTMFTRLETDAANHGVLFAADAAPLLEMASGQLTQLTSMNPKGVEALKKVQEVWLTMDWDEQPVIDTQFTLPDTSAAGDLAAIINFFLGFAKNIPALTNAPGAAALLNQLEAKPSEQGVGIRVEIPKADADAFLQRIEAGEKTGSISGDINLVTERRNLIPLRNTSVYLWASPVSDKIQTAIQAANKYVPDLLSLDSSSINEGFRKNHNSLLKTADYHTQADLKAEFSLEGINEGEYFYMVQDAYDKQIVFLYGTIDVKSGKNTEFSINSDSSQVVMH